MSKCRSGRKTLKQAVWCSDANQMACSLTDVPTFHR
jgi:hypothetical protein